MYKINLEYGNENINDIITKTLVRELKKYLEDICKKSNTELTSKHTYLSIKNKEGSKIDDR